MESNIFKTVPVWIWNDDYANITEDEIVRQLEGYKNIDGYGGVMPTLWGSEGYLSERHLKLYGAALKYMKENNMQCFLWDENRYPSGLFGQNLEEKYWARSIKMYTLPEEQFTGAESEILGVVLFDGLTKKRADITNEFLAGEKIKTEPYQKILIFTCETFKKGRILVDYLNKEAVEKMIEKNHNVYYENFSEYFSNTITAAFYDEPSMLHIDNGRAITGEFNKIFFEEYGVSPVTLYPALFMDTGDDTYKCRNMIFALRSKLFEQNYIKSLKKWCDKCGISLTGHVDQEEAPNPVNITGDLLKVFKSQDIPGVDEIYNYGRGKTAFKMISSAAVNYGKDKVMCEVFAAMSSEMPRRILFKECLDIFSRGINLIVPHGAWYNVNPEKINAPPELSFNNKFYSKDLPLFNKMCETLSAQLQGGTTIADIAVMYPIETLYADTVFDDNFSYLGEMRKFKANYWEVGETLSSRFHTDYIYLHPEVFLNCAVENKKVVLNVNGKTNYFKTLILPHYTVSNTEFLKKLLYCAQNGVAVMFVGSTCKFSSKPGEDDIQIQELVREILSYGQCRVVESHNYYRFNGILREITGDLDVDIKTKFDFNLGNFCYIHKEINNKQIYFFVNSSEYTAVSEITLNRTLNLAAFNPLNNKEVKLKYFHKNEKTSFKLNLPKISGLILKEI